MKVQQQVNLFQLFLLNLPQIAFGVNVDFKLFDFAV